MQKRYQMSVHAYFKNKIQLLPFEQSHRLPSRNGNLDIALGFPMAEALLSVARTILRDTKHTHYEAMHLKYPLKKEH